MSRIKRSVAMPATIAEAAKEHLLRSDGQEDLCFGLWFPSQGRSRLSALIHQLILPTPFERTVHGNVSFEPAYFERALAEASAVGAGLVLMHSHPEGEGWQLMSRDDVMAERGNAGAVFGATGLPFLGMTLAGDGAWSARFWERTEPKTYPGEWCGSVRVVGEALKVNFYDELAPKPINTAAQIRTISAWGEETQADLTRLRIGIVGAGSVAGFIAESLARTGFEDVMAIDFDKVEIHNLDRLNYATHRDVGEYKVTALSKYLQERGTAKSFNFEPVIGAIYEEEVFKKALDCDILFSCVDRPWGRHVLNYVAYSHLIPVVDGGIHIRPNKLGKLASADWRAHIATIGRPCLECIGQYDSGLVQVERDGYLDDPKYIEGLPEDHPLKTRQNVFAFSMACASQQMLQMLSMAISPLGMPNPGTQRYRFVGAELTTTHGECHGECLFPGFTALGDSNTIKVTK